MASESIPTKQISVNIKEQGKAEVVTDAAIPEIPDDYVLVKTVAVALNPTDWKHIDYSAKAGTRVGCDYAGTVVKVGKNLTRQFKVGDDIAGAVHGSKTGPIDRGAFGEYIIAKTGVAIHKPANFSFEEAATLGVGVTTVAQGLFQTLGLPLPGENGPKGTILVYGGSTATGTLAIQYAKLVGWKVITTCSPRNFDLVKSLGADEVFDYNDPEVINKIKAATNNSLTHVFDTISLEGSAKISAGVLAPKGKYSGLLPTKAPRDDVSWTSTLAYTAFGEPFSTFGVTKDAIPEDYAYATKFWEISEKLLAGGKLKPHPLEVKEKGLKGIIDGLDLLRKDKVSGKKLAYRIADTPK
ncbi:uncharacterized protein EV422DRAFT_524705 [Fimicolochytrium jonesii]|uniref:uncharacterized protein n=1 Tax=Fimicolochytrium jonesii TaxID=1396493 RepID=UPI0022FE4D68|nr:uncharacterized protein EV422DRAFT_524705 [Fimicolochytrium jonesii]KAI8822609.1 hypothetical protein EV422DRAFT_524705 [Fimicolochytrium jonesii]